jgi:uncharacterized repeat protein (TIGR02543 family)
LARTLLPLSQQVEPETAQDAKEAEPPEISEELENPDEPSESTELSTPDVEETVEAPVLPSPEPSPESQPGTSGTATPSGAELLQEQPALTTPEPDDPDEGTTSTVTFDGNGGRVKSKQAHVELHDGDCYGPLPTPLREGYEFLGWFTAPEGGEAIGADSVFTGTENQTLYAQWSYDPYAFWTFTLQNKTQQIYLCQQVSVYFEDVSPHATAQSVPLISATGSLNIAENRADSIVTDEWVAGKKPGLILKAVSDLSDSSARQELSARFPGVKVVLVTSQALGSDASGLYARLALAKELYPDWYLDVDLSVVQQELGVAQIPIAFSA